MKWVHAQITDCVHFRFQRDTPVMTVMHKLVCPIVLSDPQKFYRRQLSDYALLELEVHYYVLGRALSSLSNGGETGPRALKPNGAPPPLGKSEEKKHKKGQKRVRPLGAPRQKRTEGGGSFRRPSSTRHCIGGLDSKTTIIILYPAASRPPPAPSLTPPAPPL